MKKLAKMMLFVGITFCYQTAFAVPQGVQTFFISPELMGEPLNQGYTNAIEVEAWSFGGGLDSKDNVCFPGINIVKEIDPATPVLIGSSVNASIFTETGRLVQIQTFSEDNTEIILEIVLDNYFVSSYALSSGARFTPVQESLIFSFEQAELTYYKRDAGGREIEQISTQLSSGKCK